MVQVNSPVGDHAVAVVEVAHTAVAFAGRALVHVRLRVRHPGRRTLPGFAVELVPNGHRRLRRAGDVALEYAADDALELPDPAVYLLLDRRAKGLDRAESAVGAEDAAAARRPRPAGVPRRSSA